MIPLNKVCNLEDFQDRDIVPILTEWFGKTRKSDRAWPVGKEDRKFWEVAMIILAVQRHLAQDERSMALGVGAGIEATNFILSNLFRWVFLTDLYGANGWHGDCPGAMLVKPETFSPGIPINERRIIVQHMNGTDLRFEDNSFDLVYSSSSIEHFGAPEQVKQAAREMGRVVRPGGLISLSTEWKVSGTRGSLNCDTLLFTRSEIEELIIAPSGCMVVDEPIYEVSEATLAQPTEFDDAVRDLSRMTGRYLDNWSRYPHILLRDAEMSWTSVQVTLKKPIAI